MTKAYLLGILHDGTQRHLTYRVATKNIHFANLLLGNIKKMGINAWIYQEGKTRNLWIIEFSRKHLNGVQINTPQDKIEYLRGYFDAEGGIAHSLSVRYYLYYCQKDKRDLNASKTIS